MQPQPLPQWPKSEFKSSPSTKSNGHPSSCSFQTNGTNESKTTPTNEYQQASRTQQPSPASQQHQTPTSAAQATTDQIKQRRTLTISDESSTLTNGSRPAPLPARKIVHVTKKHPTTWSGEIRAAFTAVYGTPGRHNPTYWLKVGVSAIVILMLLAWLALRPSRSHLAAVDIQPIHYLSPLEDSHGADHAHPELPPLTVDDLTIFTMYSPVPNYKGNVEQNVHLRAINSWMLRVNRPEQILVYVQDYAHCASMAILGVTCRVSACWDDEYGVPRLACLFQEANRRATTELMLYVGDHIILFDDLIPALFRVGRLEHFLMVGRSQPLTLKLDGNLDLNTWQRDLESAVFLDSSAEQQQDLLGQVGFEQRAAQAESKGLHYIGYGRKDLDLSIIPEHLFMDSGAFMEHGWESFFLATLLVQDEIHVIDVSTAVTAIEFTHHDATNHTSVLNELNKAVSINFTGVSSLHPTIKSAPLLKHLALGRPDNAHYQLIGKCPTCTLKENREADLPLILLRKANDKRQIIVIATNAEYLALTFNWICRAEQLGITNYVMLAEDRVSYRILRKMNLAVVLRKDAPYRRLAAAVGSKSFQETLYLRALFFNQVVSLGFSLIMSHLDTIWFFNPLHLFDDSSCDMFIQMEKEQRSSGGLLTIRANPIGQAFTQDYLVCEQENWNFIQLHGKPRFSYSDDVDIDCVELISTRLMRRNNLKRCVLDPMKYVCERDFFDRQLPQQLGIWPFFVHLNLLNGVRNKTAAFQSWHLWAVDDDAMSLVPRVSEAHSHGQLHCLAPPTPLPKPNEDQVNEMRIVIHILVSTEYEDIKLSLLSLESAHYDAHIPVDLVVTLQQPEVISPESTAAHTQTKAFIQQEFNWKHGGLTVIVLDTFIGPTDSWIDQWSLCADNQAFILVLHAGQILSPFWFLWVKKALETYFYDPFQYDPQLMGISLQHQMEIIGETPSTRFGTRVPSQILSDDEEEARMIKQARNGNNTIVNDTSADLPTHHIYLYQYLPLTGTLFFPRHFSTFLHWYAAQNVSDVTVPCIPTLISNKWWQADPIANWWVWLERFIFEAGWYGLYTNFHSAKVMNPTLDGRRSEGPRALLVDEKATGGALTIRLLKRLHANELYFPVNADLALYDFHFQPFTQPRPQISRRKFLLPPIPTSTSMTRVVELEAFHFAKGDMIDSNEKGDSTLLTGRLHLHKREDDSTHVDSYHIESVEEASQCEIEEEEISHLDVMIESMIEEMEASSSNLKKAAADSLDDTDSVTPAGGDDTGSPNLSTLRASALARASRKRGGLHTHKAHHTLPIRGREQDRCYIVEHAAQEEETTECKHCSSLHETLKAALKEKLAKEAAEAKEAAKLAGKPIPVTVTPPVKPSANELSLTDGKKTDPLEAYANMDAEELYNLMFDVAREFLPEPGTKYDVSKNGGIRFILYQPTKPAPFDRHLRGIYFSFLIALLTNRILLIDLPDLDMLYECPFANADWTWTKYSEQLADARKDIFDNKRAADLRTNSLDKLYSLPLLIHNDMVTHDRVLFKNADYKPFSAALFGSSSRMRRTGFAIRLLLSKPRPPLLLAAQSLKQQVGLVTAKYSISVHVVVPTDKVNKPVTATEPLPGVPGRHWDCVRSFLLSMQMVSDDTLIYFSTNRPSPFAFALARKEMGKFGRVVTHPFAHNFNISTGGISSATTTSSIALDQNGREIIDPALVSGFLLGDMDVSITSGTTYGIFYAARTNFQHKALIVKLASSKKAAANALPEEDYCGPMHRLDLPLQEDITY